MKIDQVIAAVITVRDQIDAVKKKHKEELAPLNSNMEKLEAYIHLQLQKAGVNSMAAKGVGTAFIQKVVDVTVEDWDATIAWIKAQESWEFLEHRVSKTVVQDYMESTGEVPPGVRVNSEDEVRVRRG
jgi:hypothetical protein